MDLPTSQRASRERVPAMQIEPYYLGQRILDERVNPGNPVVPLGSAGLEIPPEANVDGQFSIHLEIILRVPGQVAICERRLRLMVINPLSPVPRRKEA